ncbi:MAG UNVERIFIED_CONTAM: pentapeptide repeat-containing protein [Rickettsiaceae bacterium]|jgi:uncharacterized protein YjbI with pentapeptide repeats
MSVFDTTDMSKTVAHNANLPSVVIETVTLKDFKATEIKMRGGAIDNTDISKSDLSYSDFTGSKWQNTAINNSTMLNSQFSGTSFDRVNIWSSEVQGSNFSASSINNNSKIENLIFLMEYFLVPKYQILKY